MPGTSVSEGFDLEVAAYRKRAMDCHEEGNRAEGWSGWGISRGGSSSGCREEDGVE